MRFEGGVLVALLVIARHHVVQAEQPGEREILREFFVATGGESWHDTDGWLQDDVDVCQWHGVICQGEEDNDLLENRRHYNRQLQQGEEDGGGGAAAWPAVPTGTTTSQLQQGGGDPGEEDGGGGAAAWPDVLPTTGTTTAAEQPEEGGGAGAGAVRQGGGDPGEDGGEEVPTGTSTEPEGAAVVALDLADNNLSGRTPDSIFTLPQLEGMSVSYNDKLEMSFQNSNAATKLHTIKLHDTATKSLAGIGGLKNSLTALHLSGVQISATVPEEIWELINLKELHMAKCDLSGQLSTDIGQLWKLEKFDLYENNFSGGIPSTLPNLKTTLKELTLSRNSFTGNLPTFLEEFEQMEKLYLENNNFDGPLLNFADMPKLTQLYLNYNQLTGQIPEFFLQRVTSVPEGQTVKVNLAGNQLEGTLPSSLDDLSSVAMRWEFRDNKFTGINSALCDNVQWAEFETFANQFDCDAIMCPKGTYNSKGRKNKDEACQPCANGKYYGLTTCADTDDKGILTLLYDATKGNNWKRNDGWVNDNVDVCSWYGIQCWDEGDERDGRVSHIHLDDNNLEGIIPGNLFSIETLTIVTFSRNNITMRFDSIGDSQHIHRIDVAHTQTSTFDGIDKAPDFLKHLVLDKLPIDGTIPKALFNLPNLATLSLAESGLVGTIQTMIGQLESLKELYLYGNSLRGTVPDEIGSLKNLEVLSLAKNILTGTLPAVLGTLTNLTAISFTDQVSKGGGFSGELFDFKDNAALTTVLLGGNKLEGEIPAELLLRANPRNSLTVDVSSNLLTGIVPAGLRRFERLDLYVENNELSSIDPSLCSRDDWMGGNVREFGCEAILCPEFTSSVQGRRVYDTEDCADCTDPEAPDFLGQTICGATTRDLTEKQILENLYDNCGGLQWHNNKQWKSKQAHVCDWYGIDCDEARSVVSIVLGANALVGTIPTELFQLPNLERLSLFSNDISFSFEGIENARRLYELVLDSTKLDSLEGVGVARTLTELNVRATELKGQIPDEVHKLVNLETLTLSDNKFTGTLPSWLGELPRLTGLIAARNEFTGPLLEFSTFGSLVYIDLKNNRLSGTMPENFLLNVDPEEKVFVDLSNNEISGKVPGELGRIHELVLKLQGNKIEAVDQSLCDQDGWNNGDVDKFGCDGILCPIGSASGPGRHADNAPCTECKEAKYMGTQECSGALRRLASSSSLLGLGSMLATALYLIV